jgi:hypothetical protein
MLLERCEGVRVLGCSFYSCAGLRWVRWAVAVANPCSRADVTAVGDDEGGQTSSLGARWRGRTVRLGRLRRFPS